MLIRSKQTKPRAVPYMCYITQERMALARRGGMHNFSGAVNKMVVDVYVERAMVRQMEIDACKKDFDADAGMMTTVAKVNHDSTASDIQNLPEPG